MTRQESAQEALQRKLVAKLAYYQRLYGLSAVQLADICEITRATYYNRLHQPGSFRLCELSRLARRFGVSLEALLSDRKPYAQGA